MEKIGIFKLLYTIRHIDYSMCELLKNRMAKRNDDLEAKTSETPDSFNLRKRG